MAKFLMTNNFGTRGLGMAAEECTTCKIERFLIGVEPFAGRYELKCFRCPRCETVLRLACAIEAPPRPADGASRQTAA
jgi:hypothetical protein